MAVSVLLALASAISFGISDFAGGTAARRAAALPVTFGAQVVGGALLPVLVVVVAGNASWTAVGIGAVAGLFGGSGLALYFTGLRNAAMGVVSPLSAVAAVVVPVVAGLLAGERPATLAVVGIVTAIPAIWLATAGGGDEDTVAAPPPGVAAVPTDHPPGWDPRRHLTSGVVLGLVSGAAFGLFFVLLDAAPADSGAWPLVGARIGSVVAVAGMLLLRGSSPMPARAAWGLVALSGLADMTANLLFLLAVRGGLLSLVSVVTSQYPIVVVGLSVLLLGERLGPRRRVGAALALVAVALISVA